MAVKSRIDAWTLLRVLVVPCLFLCAIFKRPIFQWIACAALFVWVCFVISKLFRSHRKHCKKMPAEQKAFPAKQEAKPLTETPQEADDDTRLSLLRQVNYRIMEQLKQSYPAVSWLWDTLLHRKISTEAVRNVSSSITVTPSILGGDTERVWEAGNRAHSARASC